MPASAGGCPEHQYPSGYKVTVVATANVGYVWTGWKGTDSNKANPSSVTMTSDRAATAYFAWNCVHLTVSVGSGHGTAQAMPTSAGGCPAGQYPSGYSVTVVATANTGYKLSGWSGTDNNKANPTKVTMKEDRQVTAYFVEPGGTPPTPTKPSEPGKTATATKTHPPEKTATPTNTHQPEKTATPTKPPEHEATATPTKPSEPEKTATPTKPSEPGKTATPTKTSGHDATATPTKTSEPEKTSTPTPTSKPFPTAGPFRGDADCNGRITAVDAAIVLQFVAGMIPQVGCPGTADANHDGRVNAVDAALILQVGAGLLSGF